jgi:hypothetical protein
VAAYPQGSLDKVPGYSSSDYSNPDIKTFMYKVVFYLEITEHILILIPELNLKRDFGIKISGLKIYKVICRQSKTYLKRL